MKWWPKHVGVSGKRNGKVCGMYKYGHERTSQLKYFCSQVLQDCWGINSCLRTDTDIVLCSLLEVTMDTAYRELEIVLASRTPQNSISDTKQVIDEETRERRTTGSNDAWRNILMRGLTCNPARWLLVCNVLCVCVLPSCCAWEFPPLDFPDFDGAGIFSMKREI